MWLFTKYGFFSIVCARVGDGASSSAIDPQRMMVRARMKAHLERLQARFEARLGGCEITESRDADYRFRVFVAKPEWQAIAAELAGEIDFDNFKSAVAQFQGPAGQSYEEALHDVWGVMYELQRRR